MFLRNYWYVAGYDHEVSRNPLRRIILGEPIVLYRLQDGTPVALEDRCAHRHLPLSMGKLVGDALQCHYHGLRYDRTGDPAQANPDTIPDYHWFDDPAWGAKGEYLHVKSNWQLIVDNLLDLTHLAFVHGTTIGNSALVDQANVKVTRTQDSVTVTRWIIDAPPPPTFVKAGKFSGNVDRWQIINFAPPAYLRLDVGATPTGTGAPQGKRVGGIGMRNLNAITPETESTSHYFWGQAHNFDVGNPRTTEMIMEQIRTAFHEDVAVFEAQQRNLQMIPNPPQADINADTGVIQARRILDRLYAEEQKSATANMAAAE